MRLSYFYEPLSDQIIEDSIYISCGGTNIDVTEICNMIQDFLANGQRLKWETYGLCELVRGAFFLKHHGIDREKCIFESVRCESGGVKRAQVFYNADECGMNQSVFGGVH